MLIEKYNYCRFTIPNFKNIQTNVLDKHHRVLNNTELYTQPTAWSYDNFVELYSVINAWCNNINTTVRLSRLFFTPPYSNLSIHADGKKLTDKYWALNIPISCDMHETHWQIWYNNNTAIQPITDQRYTDYMVPLAPAKLIEVDRVCINQPYLVKVSRFHSIENNTKHPRLVLTIRFNTLIHADVENMLANENS